MIIWYGWKSKLAFSIIGLKFKNLLASVKDWSSSLHSSVTLWWTFLNAYANFKRDVWEDEAAYVLKRDESWRAMYMTLFFISIAKDSLSTTPYFSTSSTNSRNSKKKKKENKFLQCSIKMKFLTFNWVSHPTALIGPCRPYVLVRHGVADDKWSWC